MFVSRAYRDSKAFKTPYSYVPFILNDALAGRNNLTVTKNPKVGDLAILDKEGVPTGVELFHEWIQARSRFSTIGIKNDKIVRAERSVHSLAGFVHVGR